jgi:hypothetical protein
MFDHLDVLCHGSSSASRRCAFRSPFCSRLSRPFSAPEVDPWCRPRERDGRSNEGRTRHSTRPAAEASASLLKVEVRKKRSLMARGFLRYQARSAGVGEGATSEPHAVASIRTQNRASREIASRLRTNKRRISNLRFKPNCAIVGTLHTDSKRQSATYAVAFIRNLLESRHLML